MKHTSVYIGVGSNMGDRNANIRRAIDLLKSSEGIKVAKVSSIYETEPVGGPPQGAFLNGVFEIETDLDPFDLLEKLKGIEKELGRERGVKNAPRVIDLDILLFGDEKIDTENLKVPHPGMREREFVQRGLKEIS